MIRQDGTCTWVLHNIHPTDSFGDDNDDDGGGGGGGDGDDDDIRTPS